MNTFLRIGSAILSPEYFWMAECAKCAVQPEVHHQTDDAAPARRLEPHPSPGGLRSSFRFELSGPGEYLLRNFCGGGFWFHARVRVEGNSVEVLHLQGAGEC
jgi:hypothetical protein